MKVLLLTDIPPCKTFTAGLVLEQACRFLPRGSLCCFAVVNPALDLQISPDYSGIPVAFRPKPNENWNWLPRRRLWAPFVWLGEWWTELRPVRKLVDDCVKFGREQNVDAVWAVLQGQTMIRMALPVARRLGVPLHTHVWDPFRWWAAANRLDGWTIPRVMATFDASIRGSVSCATASTPMAEHYRRTYGVDALPLIASHDRAIAQSPDVSEGVGATLTIGMAGQFYAMEAWTSLLRALGCAGWKVAGRPVRIKVLGAQPPPGARPEYVEFLGWKSQAEAAEILSACDLLYCPYPFENWLREVAEQSFPSKLVLYLAAGRPIVLHGPDYSSPRRYLMDTGAGLCCDGVEASAIYNTLHRLTTDRLLYADIGRQAQAAFLRDFTLEQMNASVAAFLRLPPPQALVLHDHTAEDGAQRYPEALPASVRRRRRVFGAAARALRHPVESLRRLGRWIIGPIRRPIAAVLRRLPHLRHLYREIDRSQAECARLRHALDVANARITVLESDRP